MRPYQQGESLYNIIKSAIPEFVESDYPLFIEFMQAYFHFLETNRTFVSKNVYPQYGNVPNSTVMATDALGGSSYETRKLLQYLDVETSLDEFKQHFLDSFGKNFPQYQYISLDFLVRCLRQFYQAKGTTDSIQWFFRVLFNEHAEVYFPRADILKASDGTWVAPITLKVSSPIDGHPNNDVPKFYIGQRVETETGSAQVEAVITYVVGQAFNQNIVVNELTLKFDTILGFFEPGQVLHNIDSDIEVNTIIYPVITDVTVNSGGSNYLPGDVVTISEGPSGGGGFGAFGQVSQISNTAINGVRVLNGGDGYITGLPVVFISTSGAGANGVVESVVYGNFLLEDDSGFVSLEQQATSDTNLFQFEDVNVLFLELLIEPFVNATSTVVIQDTDYGTEAGVAQLVGVGFDSELEIALAAVDEKPFMHPWVFTDLAETTAELANAQCDVSLTTNTSFSNSALIFSLLNPQDLASNSSTVGGISANVIVSQIAQGGLKDTIYLKDIRNINLLAVSNIFKQAGNGLAQVGTISTDGTANVFGVGTAFTSVLQGNTHVRFQNGNQVVVKQVVNSTYFLAWSGPGVAITANTYSTIPVGTVTTLALQQQRFYGKIKTVRLFNAGAGYLTPPAVQADSVSGRAQEFFYLDPNPLPLDTHSANNTIVAAGDQIDVFAQSTLETQQDTGQVQKVKIINTGVNYTDVNGVVIGALHGTPREGSDASFTPVIGALTRNPGQFTTSRGFLSADKFLQDSSFYNDFTYVIRVGESFDRYKDILLKMLHPAGFQPLGRFVDILEAELTVPAASTVIVLDTV